MSGDLGVIAASVLVFAVAALLVSLLGGALYPPIRRFLRGLPPAAEADLLLAVASAPARAGLSLLLLALAPSLAHLIGIGTDHCHEHGHHAHLCVIHFALWTGSGTDWLVLLSAGLAVVTFTGDLSRRLWQARGVARALRALALPSPAPRSWRAVDMDGPLALTAGLFRPRSWPPSSGMSRPTADAAIRYGSWPPRYSPGCTWRPSVEALLRPAAERQIAPWSLLVPGAGVILAFGCLYCDRLHHGVESALHLLFR